MGWRESVHLLCDLNLLGLPSGVCSLSWITWVKEDLVVYTECVTEDLRFKMKSWGPGWGFASNSASSTDLKRIQTQQYLFRDFGTDKASTTSWSGGSFQIWVQIWASANHLAFTPKGYSRRQFKVFEWKFWLQNQWLSFLGSTPAKLRLVRQAQTPRVSKSAVVTAIRVSSPCKAEDLYNLSEKRWSCQIPMKQYASFRWLALKSLKTISGMILNWFQPKLYVW